MTKLITMTLEDLQEDVQPKNTEGTVCTGAKQ